MLSSGIIDLAIGLAFIFGVTAALASVITEMIARFLGLRGAYLLAGLRELLDSKGTPVALGHADTDFKALRTIINNAPPPPKTRVTRPDPDVVDAAKENSPDGLPRSATGVLLGSPILLTQGVTGKISTRKLSMASTAAQDATDQAGQAENATAVPPGTEPPPAPPEGGDGQAAAPRPGMRDNWTSLPKGNSAWVTWKLRRSLPSYISSRSFAEAVIDMVIPDKAVQTNMTVIQHYIAMLPDSMSTMRKSLQSLATSAGNDVTKFRTSVENWYDDHMDRVSGWYKRHTAWITLAAGAILVLLLNINAVTIGRALYSDSAARTAVSAVAAHGNPCPSPSPSPTSSSQSSADSNTQQNCLASLEKRVSDVAQAGLPLGWGIVPACERNAQDAKTVKCSWWEQHGITTPGDGNWWQFVLAALGLLVTIAALTPGAQFWFGLVVKLNSLRSSGPPPASSTS